MKFEKPFLAIESNIDNEAFQSAIVNLFQIYNGRSFVIILNSPGGEVPRMYSILDAIDSVPNSNVSAYLPKNASCASACADVFLYIGSRFCETGSKIGLHSVIRQGKPSKEATKEMILQLLSRPGSQVPEKWLAYQYNQGVFNTTKMTYYSCSELIQAGIASNAD
ncbi:MAG: hypothetical protein VX642_16040 [Bdellovibrionota bacterium]|nr:hypothetical protein [Bdellovibrionota bacterium]